MAFVLLTVTAHAQGTTGMIDLTPFDPTRLRPLDPALIRIA
jgi:hypothetical protein